MKIYKKILLILFFTLLLLFLNNNVFASFDFEYNGTNYSLGDLPFNTTAYPDFVILYNYKDKYFQVGYPYASYQVPFYYQKTKNALGQGIQYWALGDTEKKVVGPSSNGLNWYYYNSTDNTGKTWGSRNKTSQNQLKFVNNADCAYLVYSSCDIVNENGSIYYDANPEPEYIFPYIADTDEVLTNLDNIDDILVFPGSLSKSSLPLKLSIYKYNEDTSIEGVIEIILDTNSPYYVYIVENPNDYWWEIPTELFKNSLQNGQEYHFTLLGANEYDDFSITRSVIYQGTTYVPPTDEQIQTDAIKDQTEKIEEQTDAIKDQTEKIEEQTEVNKGIFARIGEILSYINPLSENFFAYKLIDLLIDALKSLFVPEERFFKFLF